MAILKFKKLIEDLENNTTQVLSTVTKAGAGAQAGTAAVATLAVLATSAGQAGTAVKATSAGRAGTAYYSTTAGGGTGGTAGANL